MAAEVLVVDALRKSFGGFVATDGISLSVRRGEIHALLGPNGAGKSTLVNLAAGHLRPDSGRIYVDGADVTRFNADARARRGLARSFQITQLYPELSVLQNVGLAAQAHAGPLTRIWRAAYKDRRLLEAAEQTLLEVDLLERADTIVATLSHGEKRQLEFAMCLALSPKVLLLDEPMAGMGPEEGTKIMAVLKRHARLFGTLLIEHDMNAVFALADRITVLVRGAVIATGEPEEIRRNADVKRAYLGGD